MARKKGGIGCFWIVCMILFFPLGILIEVVKKTKY
jgi:hypothetical protein